MLSLLPNPFLLVTFSVEAEIPEGPTPQAGYSRELGAALENQGTLKGVVAPEGHHDRESVVGVHRQNRLLVEDKREVENAVVERLEEEKSASEEGAQEEGLRLLVGRRHI